MVGILTLLTVLCWYETIPAHSEGSHELLPCCGATFGLAFWMWVVMMAGMMVPSVAPMVLAYAGIARRRARQGTPVVPASLFLGGYVIAWSVFAFVAAFVQWGLYHLHWLDGKTLSIGPWAGALVLCVAGAFQFSAAKQACLSECRAPIGFFMTSWRPGKLGAVRMGLSHGTHCIGCCWALMLVMFSVGVMNLVWGAALTMFMIAEKVLPRPRIVVALGGVACFVGAAVLVGRALFF